MRAIRTAALGCALACALASVACSDSTSNTTSSTSNIPSDPFAVGRGGYLIQALIDCGGCHTADPTKPFAGGNQFPIDNQGHYVYSRNLTPDPKTGLQLTEDQFVQALQTGADFRHPGESLLVMPWPNFRWLATDDLKALYALLQLLPPVDNAVPDDNKGPAAALPPTPLPAMYDEGEEPRPLPPEVGPAPFGPPGATAPVPDPGHAVRGAAIFPLSYAKMPHFYQRTAEEQAAFGRGAYLVNAALCSECHTNKGGASRNFVPGPDFLKIPSDSYLTGGAVFTVPGPLATLKHETRTMSANLVGTSGFWNEPKTTFLLFDDVIQQMAHVDDDPPLPLGWPMPADHFRNLSLEDLVDIYTYMQIVAADYDHTGQVDKVTQDQARYCTASADCNTGAGETCYLDEGGTGVGNQCVGKSCTSDDDCDVCQTCNAGKCRQPSSSDACLAVGK